jgi:hypothetical protein
VDPIPTDAAGTANGDGSGIGTIDQLLPFHRSANKPAPPSPTAKQLVVLAHDTAVKFDCDAPCGFGLTTIDHLAPFQCSTNVLKTAFSEAGLVAENPTAEQSVEVAHDTPTSTPSVGAAGLGLGTIDQLDPFHRSISVAVAVLPTAKQLVAEAHDTPASPTPTSPAGCGLGTIDQLDPFHRSMNDAVNVPPTEKQLVADAHDTAETEPLGGPGGLTLGVIDHAGAAPDGPATTAGIPATKPTATTNRTRHDRPERLRRGASPSTRISATFPPGPYDTVARGQRQGCAGNVHIRITDEMA